MPARRRATAGGDEMSRLLLAVRGDRRQADMAALAGLTQSKISRAEGGRFPLSPEEADRYADVCGASVKDRRRLVQLAKDFAEGNITTRAALVRSARAIQERIGRLESESDLVRSWNNDIIPGVLQVPEYTEAVIGGAGTSEWRAAREERLRRFKEDTERHWQLIISEAVLLWELGSNLTMRSQLLRLLDLAPLSHLALGIVPLNSLKFGPPPAGSFHIYGSRTVCVGQETTTAFLTEPRDVQHYEARFSDMTTMAVYRDDAIDILQRVFQLYSDRSIGARQHAERQALGPLGPDVVQERPRSDARYGPGDR